MIEFRAYSTDDELYQQALTMRLAVLRAPLGMPLRQHDTATDAAKWHFGLVDAGNATKTNSSDHRLLATASIIHDRLPTVRLRQMAVAPQHQGLGLGAQSISVIENWLGQRNIAAITLLAREEAIGFYKKLGYVIDGPQQLSIGIPHYPMQKSLCQQE